MVVFRYVEMNKQSDLWKANKNEIPPEQFWQDFGKYVCATIEGARSDNSKYYWQKMDDWGRILMSRYQNTEIVRAVVNDYYSGQCNMAGRKI